MPPTELTRGLAIAALAAMAATHFADLADKIAEAPYMAALFIANIIASLVLAGLLIARRAERFAIAAGGLLAAATLVGFVLSRSVGLPQIEDHIGQWLDPAGIASVVAEIGMVGLAIPFLVDSPGRLAGFVTVPMVVFIAAAAAAGQSFGAGHADAHHHHDDAHHHAQYPDVDAAGATDRAKAERLLRAVTEAARIRYPTYAVAVRQGFVRYQGRPWRRPLAFHVRSRAYEHDRRAFDATRPESLVYWWPRSGPPVLVAMMFRVPRGRRPASIGSIPIFHRHANPVTGRPGATMMMHVWLTHDLRSAFANCLPVAALQRAHADFRYSKPGYLQAHETLPCAT
jgi:hypothetical protein